MIHNGRAAAGRVDWGGRGVGPAGTAARPAVGTAPVVLLPAGTSVPPERVLATLSWRSKAIAGRLLAVAVASERHVASCRTLHAGRR